MQKLRGAFTNDDMRQFVSILQLYRSSVGYIRPKLLCSISITYETSLRCNNTDVVNDDCREISIRSGKPLCICMGLSDSLFLQVWYDMCVITCLISVHILSGMDPFIDVDDKTAFNNKIRRLGMVYSYTYIHS